MNEKIKELAEQAGAGQHEGYEVLYHTFSPTALEKFAELIVKECINILPEKVKIDDLYDANILVKCGWAIKQHFGVEE